MTTPDPDKLTGAYHTAANGHLSYEIYRATPDFLLYAAEILRDHFGFSEATKPIIGLDQIISECTKEEVTLMLGWDIWSGFYILADSDAGDEWVKTIGKFFDSTIQQPEFAPYIHRW
ncbi:MAG: hypothetical protein AB1757_06115 [Acidobacteriota bacterium]